MQTNQMINPNVEKLEKKVAKNLLGIFRDTNDGAENNNRKIVINFL